MPVDGVNCVEETTRCGSAPGSAPGSPKNKIKFLCSHGGKILPRWGDCHLKYVGGETRVISLPRNVELEELMKKLTYPIEGGDMVLKYQIFPEDLDALVSVKTDEDLRHMMEEHDLCEAAGAPRVRAFLFPTKPTVLDHQNIRTEPLEQRYVDAINGKPRNPVFSVSSACSSPTSPDSCNNDAVNHDQVMINGRSLMHKVQSMPSIGSLSGQQQSSSLYIPSHQQFSHYPCYNNSRQQMYHGNQSVRPPIDPNRGSERLISVRSVGRVEGTSNQADHGPHYNYYSSRQSRGSGCARCLAPLDDCSQFYNRSDRTAGSPSPNPLFSELPIWPQLALPCQGMPLWLGD